MYPSLLPESEDEDLVDSTRPVSDLVKIRQWLQPTPYDLEPNEYSRHRASHLVGTGKWLTSTKTYRQWHSGDNGLLWIKGIPGSGKSVMAASIIDQLQQENVPVLYFFFRQIIDANHRPIAALRDWLCQILSYSSPLQGKLKGYLGRRLESLSPSDFWKDLKLALESFPRVYCVTDALDEMDEGNDGFLHSLAELGEWRPSNVKVLITSRPVASLETSLRRFSIQQIRLEERLVDLDIANYVQYRLRGSSIPKEHRSIIEEAVPGRANGLFLYAKFSMDAFLEPDTDVHEVLKTLPADLNAMYDELLREHLKRSNVSGEIQFLILQLVTHSTRPLRLLEIADVINTVHASGGNKSLKETKDLAKAACGPLLEILPDETVSVVHHSFTEFLKGHTRSSGSDNFAYPVLECGPTNQSLAVICLNYLRSGCLDNQEVRPRHHQDDFFDPRNTRLNGLRLQFPFVEYAAENWYKHARRAASAVAEMPLVYDLIDTFFAEKKRYNTWLCIDWPKPFVEGVTPLHVAALTGLTQYAPRLLQKKEIGVEARDSYDNTPLYWAATCGHAEVVQLLLANGADPDAEQNQGFKPLHQAASHNCPDVVKALLAAGVDPLTPKTKELPGRRCGNAPTTRGHTPLMYACRNGHVEAMAEFLPFMKNTEICHQALSWAAESCRATIVNMILHQHGVDVNAKYRGDTALFKACKTGDFQTIDVLLKAGADPNIFCANARNEFARISARFFDREIYPRQEPRGFTALHTLCQSSAPPECAEILLKAGANVHVKTSHGSTALHYACQLNINLIKPLLEAGADPTVENDDGETLLHTNGETDEELLPLLLGTGTVDINRSRSRDGMTPLMCRLDGMRTKSVIPFLGYKPDVNATDAEGNGVLHIASQNTFVEGSVIDALLSAGADPNLKNKHGDTPLHVMRRRANIEHIYRLFDAGADLESRNNAGQTVIFKQLTSFETGKTGRPSIFEALINKGARTDTRDYKGRTLWHHGCDWIKLLDYLKSLGLDPNVTDNKGNTPLHELAAAKEYYYQDKIDSMKYFISLGSDIDQPNHRGRTVLHILCSRADYGSKRSDKKQAIDYALEVSKNLKPSDSDGIQPLHLAATICENYVYKLLNAGADLFAVTHEGMTALHLAAWARQSGIVDMILSRLATLETKDRVEYVNQKTREGKAALHYACCSGRPETVKSLLEAGSDPNLLDTSKKSPFDMCAYFDDEQDLWYSHYGSSGEIIEATGLLLEDRTRPFAYRKYNVPRIDFFQINTEDDTTRLEEIMDLLVQYGAVITGDYGWWGLMLPRFGYTINCILNLKARVPDANVARTADHDKGFLIATYCHKATKEALKESIGLGLEVGQQWSPSQDLHPREFFQSALAMRQYGLFEEIALDSVYLINPDSEGKTPLNDLAHWGYSSILARVCTQELANKLDDHGPREDAESYDQYCISPLIVSACTRRLPNMDVLKQLVEDYGVNVDAQCREHAHGQDEYRSQVTIGALHHLATGDCWWFVEKALPYLIQKGANLELRNNEGETPLLTALSSTGEFRQEAAIILIKGGADVNAVDDDGNTCLSKVGDDLNLMKLLIEHGAQVTAEAVQSAIESAQVDILEVLLSQGDHANLSTGATMVGWGDTAYSEMPSLLYASSYWKSRISDVPNSEEKRALMMKMLLKHGADPFATFVKYTMDPEAHDCDFELDGGSIKSVRGFLTETCMVIHEILSLGHMTGPFFQMPSLDLERKDQSGCTLLLAACKNRKTLATKVPSTQGQDTTPKIIFQEIIDRGTNVMAQDNHGRTVLHLIKYFHSDASFVETLRAVMMNNPSLVHQADRAGDTPLHYALRNHAYGYVDLLLENGADPTKPDSNGDTALHHIASKLEEPALLKRFLNVGIDINTRNNQGDTPLFKYIQVHFALMNRHHLDLSFKPNYEDFIDPLLKMFHEIGADFFARNNEQSSLLHLLAAIKVDRVSRTATSVPLGIMAQFKYLMNLGLDPMAEDARQRTSLDVAAACGNDHIQKLFERKPMG